MTNQQGENVETVAESHEPEAQAQPTQQEMNWKAANETMAQQKEESMQLRQQNNLLMQRQQEMLTRQAEPAKASPFAGKDKDDILTVGEFEGALSSAVSQERESLAKELQTLKRAQVVQTYRTQYEGYDDAVRNTMKEAETNPELAEAIASSKNPHLLAYRLGHAGSAQAKQKKADAQRMLENAQKPGSVSQASTGGAAMSAVDHIMGLSDADFEKRIAAVKRGG